ncbi:MAG: hypothetical protein IAE78_23830 [Myxococcus sp.]|nr:hypothetical protein [Myxococcus sp.]
MTRLLPSLAIGLFLGALLASSCGPTRLCTATNCTGCCDTSGQCRSGFDNSACGTRGAVCGTCGLGQTCLSGACSVTGTGAGNAGTGGGFSGTGGGSAGGSTGGGSVSCNASNCPGCCSTTGQCFTGRSDQACGSAGATCTACSLGQSCTALGVGGVCLSAGPGGGSAAGGGASGGGGATGGGNANCGPPTCPNGCCSATGQCETATSARCGRNGAVCTACPSGSSCVSGACVACTGCLDISTGACLAGTSDTHCGSRGAFCSSCSQQGLVCQAGACVRAPSCTAQSCATGCCDSATGACVQRAQQTAQQCGTGTAGALCTTCTSGFCDTGTGSCSSGGFDGGGFPPLPDAGLGSLCIPGFPGGCGAGDCCFPFMGFGLCATIGNPNLLGGTTCGVSGLDCSTTTCQGTQRCTILGVCQ